MLRFSILALLLFQSRASDLLQQECTIDSYCEDTGNPAQDELEEDDEDVVISESSYASPAPKSTSGFAADLGEPQLLDAAYSDEILEAVDRARSYVLNEVMVDKKYEKVRSICKNSHQNCAFWSVLGECENNPAYMNVNCAPLCNSCEVRPSMRKSLDFVNFKHRLTSSVVFRCCALKHAARWILMLLMHFTLEM